MGLLFIACVTGDCREWQSRAAAPGVVAAELREAGVFAHDGWLIFDEKVIADCERRTAFSRFAGAVIGGREPLSADAANVRRNAAAFVEALSRIWPTGDKHIPGSDGAFRHEMSALLVLDELPVATVRPLLLKIVAKDGLTGEVAYALLTRPDGGMNAMLRDRSGETVDVRQRIYALAIRRRLGENVEPALQQLLARGDLSLIAREAIETVRRKGAAVEWDDVLDLGTE